MNTPVKKALYILKNNLIFIQPLLLYMLLSMVLLGNLITIKGYFYFKIVIIISVILLTVVFLAGWFYTNNLAVTQYDLSESEEAMQAKSINILKKFFSGAGENFLKTFTALILYFLFYLLMTFLFIKGYSFITKSSNIITQTQILMQNPDTESYLKLIKDYRYFFLFLTLLSTVINFFGVLYAAVLFNSGKNPFISFFNAIMFFFKNIIKSIYIMSVLFLIYMFISLLSTLAVNSFLFIILTVILTIYFNYYVILVFCFYNEKINSNNRAELIG